MMPLSIRSSSNRSTILACSVADTTCLTALMKSWSSCRTVSSWCLAAASRPAVASSCRSRLLLAARRMSPASISTRLLLMAKTPKLCRSRGGVGCCRRAAGRVCFLRGLVRGGARRSVGGAARARGPAGSGAGLRGRRCCWPKPSMCAGSRSSAGAFRRASSRWRAWSRSPGGAASGRSCSAARPARTPTPQPTAAQNSQPDSQRLQSPPAR
jgi:hypothetical protein